jgi:peptide/nickel transport system permease protein
VATGIGGITMLIRMTRSSMLEVVRQDYIRTARAKGVSERDVIWKHALKNALIPVATVIGMSLGTSMTGSVIAETIFSIPGLGLLMNSSINQKDYITLQGCVIVCAFIVTAMNLITDIAYAFIDPRIKAQYVKYKPKKQKEGKEAGDHA